MPVLSTLMSDAALKSAGTQNHVPKCACYNQDGQECPSYIRRRARVPVLHSRKYFTSMPVHTPGAEASDDRQKPLKASADSDLHSDSIKPALIQLVDVSKTYDLGEIQVHALKNANLIIRKGEFVSLIGPSGSGKSTLMNTLGCLDRPTSGSFLLDNQEMANLSRDGRAKIRNEHIGFVFQNFNLLNRTTSLENVELPMLYTPGSTKRKRRKKATELLDLVGLSDRMTHHPSQLSGGQQQRVAIARALANDPDILMGDEPTGNLDTRTARDVIRLFRDLNQKTDLTIILVTHDQNVAKNADRVVVMGDGEIIADTRDFAQATAALESAAALLDVDAVDDAAEHDPE